MSGETTVTLLDAQLRLVHIPRDMLESQMSSIIDCWWFRPKSDSFFSLAVNSVEVSLFADAAVIDRVFGHLNHENPEHLPHQIIVGHTHWTALELAFSGDGWQTAGQRVQDISTPLANEGISILFLSTYISDYILVKSDVLKRVTKILEQSGFTFSDPTGHETDVSEDLNKPGLDSALKDMSFLKDSKQLWTDPMFRSQSHQSRPKDKLIAVRSNSFMSSSAFSSPLMSPTSPVAGTPLLEQLQPKHSAPPPSLQKEMSILPDELVCVGLSLPHETIWKAKIQSLLFYPERILPRQEGQDSKSVCQSLKDSIASLQALDLSAPHTQSSSKPTSSHSQQSSTSTNPESKLDRTRLRSTAESSYPTPYFTLTQTSDGSSITADIRLLRTVFTPEEQEEMLYTVGEGGLGGIWSGENSQDFDFEDDDCFQGVDDQSEISFEQRLSEAQEAQRKGRVLLKAIQIPLVTYSTEEAGIVGHFARLLLEARINCLYSSTFLTANILVGKGDILKACKILLEHQHVQVDS